MMNRHAVLHLTEVPFAYGKDKDTLVVRIRTAKDDIKVSNIYYRDRYIFEGDYNLMEMKKVETTDLFDYFECELQVNEKRFRYYFELKAKDGEEIFYNERGFTKTVPEPNFKYAFQFPYLCEADIFTDIDWAKEGVVYQIFPDRFCNGDKSNDPENTLPWGEEVSPTTMFGGDLQGMIDKLPYLKDLGVTIVYTTPIFLASTNHKYNTKDYYAIDPQFGDVEKAKELVEKAHELGMKVVLDAVFNHSGDDFFAFEDVKKNGIDSKYIDWYFIEGYPINMEKANFRTFSNNITSMPKLNTGNPEVKEYLLKVGEFWIKEVGIDGWRLDVCDEVDHAFWRAFRDRVKAAKSDALIIGEIMHESKSFLRGDQLDSIMNYPFKEAATDFFAKSEISSEEFDNVLAETRASYMSNINYHMFNLLGSHDTARFLTEAKDDKRSLKLATAFQFTYVGIPYIYYGDEVGMAGETDPYCRGCMIWEEDKQDRELLDFFKAIAKIRRENKALVYGNYEGLNNKNNIIAFKRSLQGEEIVVIFNNNDSKKHVELELCGKYTELYTGREVQMDGAVDILPKDFLILKK